MENKMKRAANRLRAKVAQEGTMQDEAVQAVASDDNGEMRITDLEMTKLQLHEGRVDMNRLQAEKIALQEQLLTHSYTKQRDELRKAQADCHRAMDRAKDDYNAVRMQIQIRLGINLNDYTVNEAGILRLAPAVSPASDA